jgi:hypothetical protein
MVDLTTLKDHMLTSVQDSIENLTYIPVKLGATQCPGSEGQRYFAKLDLLEPLKGTMAIEATESFVLELIKVSFGEEFASSCDEAVYIDAIAELLNTLAGRFMASILPAEGEFDLGLPAAGGGVLEELADPVHAIVFSTADHCFRVSLYGKAYICEEH